MVIYAMVVTEMILYRKVLLLVVKERLYSRLSWKKILELKDSTPGCQGSGQFYYRLSWKKI